tara:strand:+ start:525 stop:962 length:438 start_codon:yes stop_codon:yes gene_type:complete
MNKEVTITLDEQEFIVPRLTVRKIHEIGHRIFETRRKECIDDCRAVGMDNKQTMEQVAELRTAWDQGTEVKRQAYTELGARMFLAAALEEGKQQPDVLDAVDDLVALASASANVCGLWNPWEESDKAEESNIDPDAEEIVANNQA